jgi:PAS domain S-box-containing protein
LSDSIFPDTEMGRHARALDWAANPLGAVETWPLSLRTAAAIVLRQGIPQNLCWGPDMLQIYNDAFRVIMGPKHPVGFGRPVLESWAETADAVGPLLARVLGGETVYFENLQVPANRRGIVEDAYFTFSYSPVITESGAVGGVLINCFETTEQVAGREAQRERDVLLEAFKVEKSRLEATFQQSPSFLAILRGSDNVFESANAAYEQVVGHGRNIIGTPLLEALPETRGQGFDVFLNQVRETGVPLVFQELPALLQRTAGAPPEQRYVDITCLPLVEADGNRSAVIAHGTDVTDHVRARQEVERLLAESEAARAAVENARGDLIDANARLQDQQFELALTNQKLQDNALELEAQAEELRASAAHLEERTLEAEDARRTVASIVEAITDGFVAFDADLRYTYVNRRASEMWDLAPESLLGKTPADIWPDMHVSPFVAMLRRVLSTGHAEVTEGFASSLRVPIEMRAYLSSGGGIVAFFADLTEQRRAQEAALFLAEASRVLVSAGDYQSTLANLASAAVPRLGDWCAVDVLTEPDGTLWPPKLERVAVVHQNPALVDVARRLTEEFPLDWSRSSGTPGVIRTRTPMFMQEVTDEMLVAGAHNEHHLARLRSLEFRSIIIVPLVARERVLGAMTLVMAESGRRFTARDLEIAVDLGQRAGIAIDNARLLRDAAEANAIKTEFLRTISHELRQPLNAIRGYLDLWRIGLRGELTPELRGDMERLSHNQEHLGALIEDLLTFTRLDVGRLEVERVPVPIAPVFDALESMARPEMDARHIEFSCVSCEPGVVAAGDPDRVVQICVNLVTNAMRATESGGHVRVRCRADGDDVIIEVADTGRGIPADMLTAIFDPFTQVGRALNAPKEGAGLGLAISRGLADAMGGTLSVVSVLGEGSTFSLALPRHSSEHVPT